LPLSVPANGKRRWVKRGAGDGYGRPETVTGMLELLEKFKISFPREPERLEVVLDDKDGHFAPPGKHHGPLEVCTPVKGSSPLVGVHS
jgi:hypothetical protein